MKKTTQDSLDRMGQAPPAADGNIIPARMKQSIYNHLQVLPDGRRVIFNAHSFGLAELSADEYNKLLCFASNDSVIADSNDNEFIKNLLAGEFLVDASIDELDSIRATHYISRFGNRGIGFTIIPTLACNFACLYCYENSVRSSNHKAGTKVMPVPVCDNIIKLCERELLEDSDLSICWYGGEPLLAVDVVEYLTSRLLAICRAKRCNYHSNMITNGYRLDKEMVDFLVKQRISSVQITIDGPKRIHDLRRPLKSGEGSYDAILSNVKFIAHESPIFISLRVNVDRQNQQYIPELLHDLKHHDLHQRDNVMLYFCMTRPEGVTCGDIVATCMTVHDFAASVVDAYSKAIEFGFKFIIPPGTGSGACGAVRTRYAIVEPDGSIQNCFATVGKDAMKTGDLTPDGIRFNNRRMKWLAWSPFTSECCRCTVLPLCMGGCPYFSQSNDSGRNDDDGNCTFWRYGLQPMLSIAADAYAKGLLTVIR